MADKPTLMDRARAGDMAPVFIETAKDEGVPPEHIRDGVAEGTIIITRNRVRDNVKPLAIGKGLKIKVNANIGTSKDVTDIDYEMAKLKVAEEAEADTVMDLSTGGPISELRRTIIKSTRLPLGTVPLYQATIDVVNKGKPAVDMTADDLFEVIHQHAREGVDFVTVHCGVTQASVERIRNEGRVLDIVSRGGALTNGWMKYNEEENPLFEHYDRLLEIAREFEVVLSLGDGLRPGCLADATDRGQIHELITIGELADRARERGVQVMIEGPGHVPLHQIEANMRLQKSICHGAPFYVLGPLVTDIAPGYDHITSAIGGALAGYAGADYLCYVTPSEHLRLPDVEDVKQGVIASRIAAHAADIAKGLPGAMDRDNQMARNRKALDWEAQINLSIDPARARKLRESSPPQDDDFCTMCGELCAIKLGKVSDD